VNGKSATTSGPAEDGPALSKLIDAVESSESESALRKIISRVTEVGAATSGPWLDVSSEMIRGVEGPG
jgi:hypothetical protein